MFLTLVDHSACKTSRRSRFLICFCFFVVQVNDDFGHVRQSLTNLKGSLLRNISSLELSQSMVGLRRL